MSHLQIALLLTTALDITAVYAAVVVWLRGLRERSAVAFTSCEPGELGSRSKRPY